MRIDKESRKFLDRLIALEPDYARGVYTYQHMTDSLSVDEVDMFRIIKNLENKLLVEYATMNGVDFGVALTQDGKTHKELRRLDARERWLERLWGFLTGAALVALTWWLTTL